LASVAVNDLESAVEWYAEVLGRPGNRPMSEVAEWRFPRGGCLQVYRLPERAGNGSLTLAVDDIEEVQRKLAAMGLDTSERSSNDRVDTLMVTDPDGNHLAFAEAHDPTLAR
jgi:catechol 2,3-dioxygenase-like lactoylglutathione lyase family enzyme